MTSPLFSTYRQGENRVTATLLAVLQRLSLPNIDRILQALLEDTDLSLVTFDNQPKGKDSTPDARIGTGQSVWIETKTARAAVNPGQIRNHLRRLSEREKLLLLTPDDHAPSNLPDRVAWSNFSNLVGAIDDILEDKDEPPSEKESFLLREFTRMLRQDGLLDSAEPRVMVLAAKWAWPMYELLSVYRCSTTKPMRSLRESDRLAFYVAGEIKPQVPRIMAVVESIDMTQREDINSLVGNQKNFAEQLLGDIERHKQWHDFGKAYKLMFLTESSDRDTEELESPIINDKKDKNGKPAPFTYGQPRYVTLESLKKASETSQLEFC